MPEQEEQLASEAITSITCTFASYDDVCHVRMVAGGRGLSPGRVSAIIRHRVNLHDRLVETLDGIQWGGTYAYHTGVFNSTTRIQACPSCGGINPDDPQSRHLIESTHGHRDDCAVAALIAEAKH